VTQQFYKQNYKKKNKKKKQKKNKKKNKQIKILYTKFEGKLYGSILAMAHMG
jgi:hypothetical protein